VTSVERRGIHERVKGFLKFKREHISTSLFLHHSVRGVAS